MKFYKFIPGSTGPLSEHNGRGATGEAGAPQQVAQRRDLTPTQLCSIYHCLTFLSLVQSLQKLLYVDYQTL